MQDWQPPNLSVRSEFARTTVYLARFRRIEQCSRYPGTSWYHFGAEDHLLRGMRVYTRVTPVSQTNIPIQGIYIVAR
jgi:hypothetical protein